MNSPCKSCERRKLLCHSVCEDYKSFIEKNEEAKHKRMLENDSYPKWKTEMKSGRYGKEIRWFKGKK